MMRELEAQVLDEIDLDALVETASELIAFESDGGREVHVQEHVAGLMERLGMEPDVWEIDLEALSRHPAHGAEIERGRAVGVVGRFGGGTGRTLILNAHVDVVPAGEPERWTVPAFRGTVRDGRLWGRGSVDMKGALACALHAVDAVRRAGVELEGTVLLQSVAGEEDGGLGTLAALERGHRGDAAIVLEPTELMVAPAQGGALSFRIAIPGRAAHGALRTEGVNPLDRIERIRAALEALETRRCARLAHPLFAAYEVPFPLCIGKVYGGVWASTVAERVTLEGRYGVGIGESCDEARREFEAAVAEAARGDAWLEEHPPEVTWWGARFEPAHIPADHPLVATLSDAFETAAGRRPLVRGMPYGADMRLLVNEGGIPTVLFGPGDIRRAHAPDESVPLADLEAAVRTLVVMILRFCGGR